jgi:hypothetical protein
MKLLVILILGCLVSLPIVIKIVKDIAALRREWRKEEPRDL